MEKAYSLYVRGQLRAAIAELGDQLRRDPQNAKARTFLFELLCFAGEFDRAEKHLDVLATQSEAASTGAAFYRGLLTAHRQRESSTEKMSAGNAEQTGTQSLQINGTSYSSCMDADQRVEGGLETYGPRGYEIIRWEKIQRLETPKPARLRDLLWIPATLFPHGEEPHPVYLPALAPGSWRHSDDNIRLGRATVLEEESEDHFIVFGAKLLLCDEETIPLLDVRTIEAQR